MKMTLELPLSGTWLKDLGRSSPFDRVAPLPLPFTDVGYYLNRVSIDGDKGTGVFEMSITESEFATPGARTSFETRLVAFAKKSPMTKKQEIRKAPLLGPNAQAGFTTRNSTPQEKARSDEIKARAGGKDAR